MTSSDFVGAHHLELQSADNISYSQFPGRLAPSLYYVRNLMGIEAEIFEDSLMGETEEKGQDELSLLRRGVDLSVVDGLKLAQKEYRARGKDFDLEEVYALEVDPDAQVGAEDVEYSNG